MDGDGKWFVALTGEQMDLDAASQVASECPGLSMQKGERDGSVEYRLTSQFFDACMDAKEVRRTGEWLVEQINGALFVEYENHLEIRLQSVGKLYPDGRRDAYALPEGAQIRTRVGKFPHPPGEEGSAVPPSPAAALLIVSQSDRAIERLLRHIAEGSWTSLYKAWEVMCDCTRNGEQRLAAMLGLDAPTVDSFRKTANYEPRHDGVVKGWPKPARFMSLNEAKGFIHACTLAWVEHITSEKGCHDRNGRFRLSAPERPKTERDTSEDVEC